MSEVPAISASFIAITVILSTIVAGTVVGNFFVIVAILVDKNLQTTANQLVLSLAVADLMVACLVMPLGAYNDIHQGWYLSKEVCEFWTSADVLCCTASILNLLAIALDRYWAVTNADYIYRRTRRRVNVMILCAWTVGAVVSLAPIFGWKDPDFANRVLEEHKCMVSQDVAYQIFATISTFYAPLVLLLALYWRIFQVARKRIRRKPGRQQALRVATAAAAAGAPDPIGAPKQVGGSLSGGQTSGRIISAGRLKVWPVGAAPADQPSTMRPAVAEEEPSGGLAVVTWVRPPGQGAKESGRQMTISTETGNETSASASGVQMDDNNKNNELPTSPQRATSFPASDKEKENGAPHRLHSATHWRPPKGPPEKPLGAGQMAPPGSNSDSWPHLGHCRRLGLRLPCGQWSGDHWNGRAMIEKPNFTSTTKAKLTGHCQAAPSVQPAPPQPCLCPAGAATGSLGAIEAARGRKLADKAGRPVERGRGGGGGLEPSGVDSSSPSWLARLASKRRERPGRGACPGSGAEHEGMPGKCESCGPANEGAGGREPACTGCCCAYCSACELCHTQQQQQQQQPYLSDTCAQCGARPPSQLVGVERAEAGPEEGQKEARGKGGGGEEAHLSGLEVERARINHGTSGSPSMAGVSAARYLGGSQVAAGMSHSAADSRRNARDEGRDKPDQAFAGPKPARATGAPGCPGCGAGAPGAHFGGRWPGDLSVGVAVPVAAPKTSGSPHKVAPAAPAPGPQCGVSRSGSLSSLSCSLAWPTASPQRAAPASTAGSLAPTTEAVSLTGRRSSNCDSDDSDDRTSNGQRGEREEEEESDEWPPVSEPSASLSAPFPPPLHSVAPVASDDGGRPSGVREQVFRASRKSVASETVATSGSESPGARLGSGSANTDLDSQDSLDAGGAKLPSDTRPTTTPSPPFPLPLPLPVPLLGSLCRPNSIERQRRADRMEAGYVEPSGQAPTASRSPLHSLGANNQVVSSARRRLAETLAGGGGDMKKEPTTKDNRTHVNDKLRPTRAQTSGPQTRRHAFLRGHAVSAPNTVHGGAHKDRPDLGHCHSHEHESHTVICCPPASRPGLAPLADAHAPHPDPIRPARSLDIRGKFRAMGQLVSFIQTSKSVNSNSSASASSSHAGREDCLFVLPDSHTHPLASGPEEVGGADQSDQGQQVVTLVSLSVQAHLDEERGAPPPTSNHLKVARQEGKQQQQQQPQGAREPSVPGSSGRTQGRAAPLAENLRPDLAVQVRSPTQNAFAARCNGRTRTEHMDIRREKKAAKTLAIITGVFVCCWLPFFLNAIIMPICGPACTPSDLILSILLWLGYLNSLLNPIIYTIFSPDFRRAFRRLLCLPQLIRLTGALKSGR